MIGIVDYDVGNLFSLRSSFAAIGERVVLCRTPKELNAVDKIVLPGVGAFGDAAKKLFSRGLAEAICQEARSGKPLLGICLGMQLLLEVSYEYGEHKGLGLISGEVRPIADVVPPSYKIPHMGWNALQFTKPHPLFKNVREGDHVYFVHSYYAANTPYAIATAEYGAPLTAAVANKNVMGCQFHPEKSGEVGLSILKTFCGLQGEELC